MRIGIDLGGTKTELIALDDSGRELYRKRIPTERAVYSDIVAMIARLVTETETLLRAKGTVGVGIPGAVSARSGLIKNASLIELNGHALDRDLSQALEREVRCVNDANCLAVSEATDGAGKGRRMVFAVIIGTGCGSGIAIDGHAWNGANLVAGEWAHNPLPFMRDEEFPGLACWCGKRGCLETLISGTGFEKDYAEAETGGELQRRGPEIIELMRAGDIGAKAAFARYADRLARGLAHVINILDPDMIVLGGGMSNVAELYKMLPPLLPLYVFGGEAETPVVQNHHGDSSGVRGAAWLWPPSAQAKLSA
jgi:fructokinase